MEKSIHQQQSAVQKLETEAAEHRQVEAHLRSIFEYSPDLILEINRAGTILFTNRHADMFQGHQVYVFVPPGDHPQVEATIAQAFETGQSSSLELQNKENDGTFQWNTIRFGPVLSEGRVASLVLIIANIHTEKESVIRARRHAEQLATIIEISHAVSTLQSLDSVLEAIYHQSQRVASVDVFYICLYDEKTNQITFPLTYDEGIRYTEPAIQFEPETWIAQVIQTRQPFMVLRTEAELQKPITSPIGNYQRKSASILLVPLWLGGRVMGVLSVQSYTLNAYTEETIQILAGIGDQVAIAIHNARLFTDVQQELAERKRAEELTTQVNFELQRRFKELYVLNAVAQAGASAKSENEMLEMVVETLYRSFNYDIVAIGLWDEKAGLLRTHPSAHRGMPERITHMSSHLGEGVVGRVAATHQFYRVKDIHDPLYQPIDPAIRSELCVPVLAGEKLVGVLDIESRQPAAFNDADEHLLFTITGQLASALERLRAEQQLRSLNTELEQRVAERTAQLEVANKELEAFSYSVSHDLRSPLRAINGFARILEDDFSGELSPAAHGFLAKIRTAGGRMTQLIDNLLDFSRVGRKALDRQVVDLGALVREVLDSLAAETANRQIEWRLPELPAASADPSLLRQVYANLLGNAVKYTSNCTLARIEVGSLNQNGETVYFVRDNGAGFDMQYADKLFGVFQRLHREDEFEGTGIGLATVRRIIERHGGRIWAEAAVDKGAAFYFTLP